MTRFASMLTVAASLTVATFAEAGEIALSQPIQAASLHDKGVDMVVYYTDETSHFEVVATYVTAPAAEPRRMRMGPHGRRQRALCPAGSAQHRLHVRPG